MARGKYKKIVDLRVPKILGSGRCNVKMQITVIKVMYHLIGYVVGYNIQCSMWSLCNVVSKVFPIIMAVMLSRPGHVIPYSNNSGGGPVPTQLTDRVSLPDEILWRKSYYFSDAFLLSSLYYCCDVGKLSVFFL